MKYFLDTEFLEGKQYYRKSFIESLFSLKKLTEPTIDLISIGIVSEDGRVYYAISKEFNLREAWYRYDIKSMTNLPGDTNTNKLKVYWIRDNVLKPIYNDLCERRGVHEKTYHFELSEPFSYKSMKYLLNRYGKTKKQIAEEIIKFTDIPNDSKPQFYGYYSDYDWVVFCWLFGHMIDLPKNFPMYCIDLKQELDRIVDKSWKDVEMSTWGHRGIENVEKYSDYPPKENVHNALSDAIWNKNFYEFLLKLDKDDKRKIFGGLI